MRTNYLRALGIVVIVGIMLTGCHADVDLNNVDTTSEVSMDLQLPVGSFKVTLGDLLKTDTIPDMYYDSVDNKGVLTFKKSINPVTKSYHQVDLSEHISNGSFSLLIKDKIAALMDDPSIDPLVKTYFETTGSVQAIGGSLELNFDFPMTLELNGINDNTSSERLDSAQIERANFVSQISRRDMDQLKWEWVKSITMDLGDNIYRKEHILTIYDRDDSKFDSINDYNTELPLLIQSFTLCLMNNPKGKPGKNNVLNECEFRIYISIEIPENESVTLSDNSAFVYNLNVQFIDYKAIWGMYNPSNQMRDADSIDMSDTWNSMQILSNAKMPFASPKIDLSFTTALAGAIELKGDYLYSKDIDGIKHYALFNNNKEFKLGYEEGEYLDPYTSKIGETKTMEMHFDNTPAKGEINRLFEKTPYSMYYMFGFAFDESKTPQIRILPSTSISLQGTITLPMIFNEGVQLQYTDTLRDVSLSQYSIDSLLGENSAVKVDSLKSTTNVNAVINVDNYLPFDVKAVLRFLDDEDNVIYDPETGKEMMLTENDTIHLKAPDFSQDAQGNWVATPNPDNLITASLTKAKLDNFSNIKSIVFLLIVDDESLQSTYEQGNFNVKIEKDAAIAIKIGLTAQLDAVLHFETQNNK